jgi:hypothetical protein
MIPDVDFLKSSPMVHRFGDVFNPPGLTNFLGVLQTEIDITGISSLNFPPFATANQATVMLYINNCYFPATGEPITFTWYPDRIERETEFRGLYLKSVTVLAVKRRAVIIDLQIENRSGSSQDIDIGVGCQGGITKSMNPWLNPLPPCELDNIPQIDHKRKALILKATQSAAFMIQGANPVPDKINSHGLAFSIKLPPGAKKNLHFVISIEESIKEAQKIYDAIISNVTREIELARAEWNEELLAIFTPGNSRYSGSLPTLVTKDTDILRLYLMSILGVVYFKRDNPYSVYGRAYDTLMPRYWQSVTFIWDYALSAFTHALLDPAVMKKYLEKWMLLDIYNHFGTEYLTGGPVGYWYSANDFNMMAILYDYLRWTGNYQWLKQTISGPANLEHTSRTVLDYIEQYASSWQRLKSTNGLADYGGINNLLECVSTYIHQVASLNAANVFIMRKAVKMMQVAGRIKKSDNILKQADQLVKEVQKLYAVGKGFWHTCFPNGSLVEVRHCYDFFTIINTIGEDLSKTQKEEMVQFFRRDLQTAKWMHALAPSDSNAMFSPRPDHQWNGAYPAWPAHSLKALYRLGQTDLAFRWLKGLAKSFNQGPLGQAHFVENVIDPEAGGARKAPPETPYMTDWACTGGGSWVSVIIESIFGVKAELDEGLSANPQFGAFDPKAELHDLIYQDRTYHVNQEGLIKG